MATIGSLTLNLTAESATLVREIEKSNRAISNFARHAEQQTSVMNRGFGAASAAVKGLAAGLAGLALGVGIGGLVRIGRQALDSADALNDLRLQTGISIGALQSLQRQAELSGSSAEALDGALRTMTRGVGQLQLARAGCARSWNIWIQSWPASCGQSAIRKRRSIWSQRACNVRAPRPIGDRDVWLAVRPGGRRRAGCERAR
jgi:hypothetical protein